MKRLLIVGLVLATLVLGVTSGPAWARHHGRVGFGVSIGPPAYYYSGYPYYGGYYGPGYYGYGRSWVPGHWSSRWTPYGWQRVWVRGYWQGY